MLKRVSKKSIFLRYMASFLIPVAITVVLTFLSVWYLNNFVKEKNTRFSENVARQLCADMNKIMEETDMVILSYITDLNYFKRLGSVLVKKSLTYEELQALRFCQDTINISAKVHPYIRSIYCMPYTERLDSPFMVSFDGVYTLNNHPDQSFITDVLESSRDTGIVFRNTRRDSQQQESLLSRYALVKSVNGKKTEGVMIMNLDIKYIESMLNKRVREQTDNLFLISWDQDSPVFASDNIRKLGTDGMKEILACVSAGLSVELPYSDGLDDYGKSNMVKYLPLTGITSEYGFTVYLLASRNSLYATSENLITVNLIVILFSIFIGIVIIVVITHKRYSDIVRLGNYLDALDEATILPESQNSLDKSISKHHHLRDYVMLHISERELKERKMEIQLLRSQLNPHFLLNTLQMLNWKIMREFKGYSEFNSIIENLCKILSHSLYQADSLTPLADEIRYTNSYTSLQCYTKSIPIQIQWEIDDAMHQYMVPRMIFQPIIENTYKHAFCPMNTKKESPSNGHVPSDPKITVRAEGKHGDLHIIIRDNGCGMDAETLERVRESLSREPAAVSSIGLSNTHKRIQLLFGRRFGVTVNSIYGKGTEVIIILPMLMDQ